MIAISSPRQKLWVALGALCCLAVFTAASSLGAVGAARLLLGLAALAGIAVWTWRARGPHPKFKLDPRLLIVGRASISPRSGVALVEVDGAPFLVVHGDGYAQVHSTGRPARRDGPVLLTESSGENHEPAH